MGHNVFFIEDSNDYPSCYQPLAHQFSQDPSYGLGFLKNIFSTYGLTDNWAYYDRHKNEWHGADESRVKKIIRQADLFINLSGNHPLSDLFYHIPIRAFIDTDPVFTQVRNLTDKAALEHAKRHTHFFTYGENFGKPACTMPDDGLAWMPTRQPAYIKAWDYQPGNKDAHWTTVMQWDSYKSVSHAGKVFGMKSASFADYIDFPKNCKEVFELAIGSATAPKEKLQQNKWLITDPVKVTLTPATYQQYIQQSKGEWSVAKQGYVDSGSGWFSDRSTGYLASGRPVIVEDTGFTNLIETGRGLFSFSRQAEALAAIDTINANYQQHCGYAREIAAAYFSFDRVLSKLLNDCKISTPVNF